MKLKDLREEVCEANLDLVRRGLVIEAFGNVSGIDRERDIVAIKPSGVDYRQLRPQSLVLTDLDGNIVDGSLRPSSDLPTHLVLYAAFPRTGGIAHTHSLFATVWAQARLDIPCFGTTHADYFPGPIPTTGPLASKDILTDYEINTGRAIVHRLQKLDPDAFSAALVASHGPFCWGRSATDAVHTAAMVEQLAKMAYYTVVLNPNASAITSELRDKHFFRKHGPTAYYGQERPRPSANRRNRRS